MKVQLAEGWHIRPTQDGLELMAPERNIALELSDVAFRDELTAILTGEAEIPANSEAIEETLRRLENTGSISWGKEPVPQKLLSAKEKGVTWRIRGNLVGSRGPVISVYWLDPSQSKLSLSQTHLFTAKYLERTGHEEETQEAWASGNDTDWEQAEFKAIMEAAERHACGVIPREQLIRGTSRKLGDRTLDPRKMMAYTKTQYRNRLPFTPFSRDREYYWKSVLVLPGGEEKYLPVECLYYPVDHELTPNPYTAANSSGVAAGLNFEDALLRGLYEAIERDAFMMVWLNRIRMPRIDHSTIPSEYQDRVLRLGALGYRMHFVDITLDFAPVVLAIGRNEDMQPSLVLGAASGANLELTIGKALSEVEHQLFWEWRDPNNIRSISDPQEVNDVLDHMALYASPEHLAKAAFLWSGEIRPMDRSNSGIQDTSTVVEKLKQHGIETVVLDLTPEYLKKAGVWVVRAIPLGLIPISFGYGNEPLRMARYVEMAKRGNPWPAPVPFPHPFA